MNVGEFASVPVPCLRYTIFLPFQWPWGQASNDDGRGVPLLLNTSLEMYLH